MNGTQVLTLCRNINFLSFFIFLNNTYKSKKFKKIYNNQFEIDLKATCINICEPY